MIDADDLRDALIYGIRNAQQEINALPDPTPIQQNIKIAVQIVLDNLTDKLTGDWPPTRD